MDTATLLASAKQRHAALYGSKEAQFARLQNDQGYRRDFIAQVDSLLNDVSELSGRRISLSEYRWLVDVAVKWQVAFSTMFNLSRGVAISPASERLFGPAEREEALTEAELEYWIARNAEYFAFSRRASDVTTASSKEEREADWKMAAVFLASDILDGKINFARRIAPASYYRLENEWVKEVKKLRAYFRWERKGKRVGALFALEDYYEECAEMRSRLKDRGIKGLPTEFGAPRHYIEERYLANGSIDLGKQAVRDMIERKARRIQSENGQSGEASLDNAQVYMRMFYEHIIPAALERDEEHILTVLKAFQFSRAPENDFFVINCFEAALAIYFLDASVIEMLWEKSATKPRGEAVVESVVEVPYWPEHFQTPEECVRQFRVDGRRIYFTGMMSSMQRRRLWSSVEEKCIPYVDQLFEQSRVIHEESTL